MPVAIYVRGNNGHWAMWVEDGRHRIRTQGSIPPGSWSFRHDVSGALQGMLCELGMAPKDGVGIVIRRAP